MLSIMVKSVMISGMHKKSCIKFNYISLTNIFNFSLPRQTTSVLYLDKTAPSEITCV